MTTLGTGQSTRTPTGLKVAATSYDKLEALADQLRPSLPVVPSINGVSYMLDSWRILEQTLPRADYQYRVEAESSLEDCAAFTIPDWKLVVIRQDVYDGLFTGSPFARSTVVHEVAHIALGHAVTLHRGATLTQHRFFEDSEWQAKAFTAALMMPKDVCLKARSAAELAEMCGTSQQAAGYRLERLIREGIIPRQRDLWT